MVFGALGYIVKPNKRNNSTKQQKSQIPKRSCFSPFGSVFWFWPWKKTSRSLFKFLFFLGKKKSRQQDPSQGSYVVCLFFFGNNKRYQKITSSVSGWALNFFVVGFPTKKVKDTNKFTCFFYKWNQAGLRKAPQGLRGHENFSKHKQNSTFVVFLPSEFRTVFSF